MLPDLPSRQAASLVGACVGGQLPPLYGVFTPVSVLDKLDSLVLVLPLTVGVILLRGRSGVV